MLKALSAQSTKCSKHIVPKGLGILKFFFNTGRLSPPLTLLRKYYKHNEFYCTGNPRTTPLIDHNYAMLPIISITLERSYVLPIPITLSINLINAIFLDP